MIRIIKGLISKLPLRYQQKMKRWHFARHIRKGVFQSDEPEFRLLDQFINEGDLVLDIGANVGQYTHRLSMLVGAKGRVVALEPVPDTFELLASNAANSPFKNITLLNIAASEKAAVVGMKLPKFDTGLKNYYMAQVANNAEDFFVMCLAIDSLNLGTPVRLAKIDVEGHELSVLMGMNNLLERDHPDLIIEGDSHEVASYLKDFGYTFEQLDGSPNRIYRVTA